MHVISLKENAGRDKRVTFLLSIAAHTSDELRSQCDAAMSSIWSALWLIALASDSDVTALVSVGANVRLTSRLASLNIDVAASAQNIEMAAGITVKAFGYGEWESSFERASDFVASCHDRVQACWSDYETSGKAYRTTRQVTATIVRVQGLELG